MRYSMVASLTGVATTAVFWVDRLLVGYYLPAAQAGLYQAASQISVVFVVVLSGLNRIQIPMLASLFQQGRHADMEEVFRVGTKWGVYLCLPILIVIMLAPANVLSATYGGEFSGGRTILLVLLIGQFANLITGPVGPILVATGNEKTALALSAAGLLLSVVMCTALIPRWGTLGAAVATSAALGLLYLGALLSVRSRLSLWPYDWRFIKGILAALASTAAVAAVTRLDVAHPLSALLIQLCVATVVLVIVLLLAGLDAEDVEMLRQLRKSVRI
jgi:O-antigen/teichoic acid export membrane protein